jgi:Suppressor of fused protein (SUFU)
MTISKGDIEIIEALGNHIQVHIGAIAMVFHEKVSPDIHVDIYHVAPSSNRPFHTLVSCGMSESAMTVPHGWEDGMFAEVMMCPPEAWPVNMEAFKFEKNYWPVRTLKALARYPHENKTWLYAGHSIAWGAPPKPVANGTKLNSVLIRHARLLSPDATVVRMERGKEIRLWAALPLYTEESEFKDRNGFAALDELLDENNITELLDASRLNVALRH